MGARVRMSFKGLLCLCAPCLLALLLASARAAPSRALELHAELQTLRKSAHVWMSIHEQALIESFLRSDHKMLEWGSGYSTLWFSQFVSEYYAIEHNSGWHQTIAANMSEIPNVKRILSAVAAGHKGWDGHEEGTEEQFLEYVHAVKQFGIASFDRVLIDGRARVACAEHVLPYLAPDALVFIHDYVVRPHYHTVAQKHYTEIARISDGQTLVVLKPRLRKQLPQGDS